MPEVGLLWRAEWDPPEGHGSIIESCKLREMFRSFAAMGVPAQPVVYSDDTAEAVRDQLLSLDGVLVWVNPIEQGLDRTKLDAVLREVADAGVWVSAHPDVILKMATKQVLVDTRQMSWGTDTRLYRSAAELRADLPSRIAKQAPLVLKQNRGMGGNGVWKVEPDASGNVTTLRVQHAMRDSVPESLSLDEFVARCEPYFAGNGLMVAQPYQARLAEGLIRVYMTHDQVGDSPISIHADSCHQTRPQLRRQRRSNFPRQLLTGTSATAWSRSGCRSCKNSSASTPTDCP